MRNTRRRINEKRVQTYEATSTWEEIKQSEPGYLPCWAELALRLLFDVERRRTYKQKHAAGQLNILKLASGEKTAGLWWLWCGKQGQPSAHFEVQPKISFCEDLRITSNWWLQIQVYTQGKRMVFAEIAAVLTSGSNRLRYLSAF